MTVSMLPKGTAFTRLAIALARSRGNLYDARLDSEGWRDSPQVHASIKTAIDIGGSQSGNWAENLAFQSVWSDFLDVLRPATILGRLAVRTTPFSVVVPRVTSGTSASWVGQTKPTPVSKITLDTISLAMSKIQSLVIITDALLKQSSPAAEAVIRRDLVAALAQHQDASFVDPTITAEADVRPASITNGAPGAPSTGSSVAQIAADVALAFASGLAGNVGYQSGAWIMSPRTALHIGSLLTTGNVPMWPTINVRGGTFYGLPVLVSTSVPVESGGDTTITLIDASEVLVAQGPVLLDASGQASVQVDDAPQDGEQATVSLWQNNLVGLRATQFLNWRRARDEGTYVISGVSY